MRNAPSSHLRSQSARNRSPYVATDQGSSDSQIRPDSRTQCVCFVMSQLEKQHLNPSIRSKIDKRLPREVIQQFPPSVSFTSASILKHSLKIRMHANNSAHIARGQTSEKLLRSLFFLFGCCGQNFISKNNSKHRQRRSGDHTMFFFCHWTARNWRDLKLHLLQSACCNS